MFSGVAKKDFEARVREFDRLPSAEPETALPGLRKALRDRNNYLVSKAANVVADLAMADLVPELVEAYGRFFVDAKKRDPRCWAKIACAKALRDLGYRGANVFLLGIEQIQMEPVWGGGTRQRRPLTRGLLDGFGRLSD